MDISDNRFGTPFSTLCRTCLRPKEGMKTLYEQSMIDLLVYCASVKVVHGDGLPSNICLQCLRQVHKLSSFKKLCEKSDATLRRYRLYGCLPPEDVLRADDMTLINIVDEQVDPPDNSGLDVSLNLFNDQDSDLMKIQHFTTLSGRISEDNDASEFPELGLEPECNLIENALAAMKEDMRISDLPNENETSTIWLQQTDSIMLDKQDLDVDNMINFNSIPSLTEPDIGILTVTPVIVENIEKSFSCEECKEAFTSAADLNLHMSIHSPGGVFQCNACNKQFPQKTMLKRHIKTHMSWKAHKCQFCSKKFSELGKLNKHMKSHSVWNQKRFLCVTCGKGYQDSDYLAIHVRKHTGERPFPCKECGKSFSDPRLLSSHTRIHTQEKPHQCSICAKRFAHSSTLTTHLRTHTGEKPYGCKECGKSFIQSSNLSLHMRTHTGEKPYVCGVCKSSFASSSTLTYHSRRHTGERPYQCTVCGKYFARSEDVTLHMRIHTGDKPFKCSLCDKRFTTSSHKNQHMDTHSQKQNKDCTICGKDCTIKCHKKKHSNSKIILNSKILGI